MPEIVRQCVQISGVVQGVGFRPFIWRRATRLGLAGWVENNSSGVVLEVQGKAVAVATFLDGLASSAPPLFAALGLPANSDNARAWLAALAAVLDTVDP
jgi:hydrogenase maturation protein HypF